MPSPREIFERWHGVIDHDFFQTIRVTFNLPAEDAYVYRAESFAMTPPQIQSQLQTGNLKYRYQSHGQRIEVAPGDITAYTSLFSPTTDTSKALTAFAANAKRSSPREIVAQYLQSRRICPTKIPRTKAHVNPYYDIWVQSCHLTSFLGPLPDASYSNPANAKMAHPILPVLYHHFGCVVPSYDALYIISKLAKEKAGVIDMASGNGYWTYMLRRMKVDVQAVDSMVSEYRTLWISDTVRSDGVAYLQRNNGGQARILLMGYMITAGTFTTRVLQAYRGDMIVVVGTQNANGYTGFADRTMEEYFEKEMAGWEMVYRIALPSFAGKDEGMYVWRRVK